MDLVPQTNYSLGPGEIGLYETCSLIFRHCDTDYYLVVMTFGPGEMPLPDGFSLGKFGDGTALLMCGKGHHWVREDDWTGSGVIWIAWSGEVNLHRGFLEERSARTEFHGGTVLQSIPALQWQSSEDENGVLEEEVEMSVSARIDGSALQDNETKIQNNSSSDERKKNRNNNLN